MDLRHCTRLLFMMLCKIRGLLFIVSCGIWDWCFILTWRQPQYKQCISNCYFQCKKLRVKYQPRFVKIELTSENVGWVFKYYMYLLLIFNAILQTVAKFGIFTKLGQANKITNFYYRFLNTALTLLFSVTNRYAWIISCCKQQKYKL